MTVDHLRRMPGKWVNALSKAGVVIGVFLITILALDMTPQAYAADMGGEQGAKAAPTSPLGNLRNKYGAVEGIPGATAPTGGDWNGDDVEQPIAFPHNTHADVNKINCLYCHTYARRSKVSGIPPTSKCMGCHRTIATDKPEIQKLTQMWESGQAPQWKKVHDLPDYVHFTHERHLKKFLFDNAQMSVDRVSEVCAMCHGNVKAMTVAKKQKTLTMGFCVDCHQQNDGPADCMQCHK